MGLASLYLYPMKKMMDRLELRGNGSLLGLGSGHSKEIDAMTPKNFWEIYLGEIYFDPCPSASLWLNWTLCEILRQPPLLY